MPTMITDEEEKKLKLVDVPEEWRGGTRPPNPGRNMAAVALVVLAVLAIALFFGLRHQHAVRAELAGDARDHMRAPVSVIHPQSSASQLSLTLPANVQAYVETPIYARTNGYIKRWLVDIGAHVQRGQLLAEIETPELDRQLQQAQAAQAQAQANLDLARITAARYADLAAKDSVSKQETDQANGNLNAMEASLKAAMANVNQLKELQSFENVTAPFAGTITGRYIDIGALIASGTNTILFRLAETSTLRVYANVPEADSKDIAIGVTVDLETPRTRGKKFAGRVVRTAGAIDPASRTLLTEIEVPNPNQELIPGEFGEVTFHLQASRPVLIVPSSTLLFRAQGTQVALVSSEGKVEIQKIQVGRDLGSSVEVLSGLTAQDAVIDNPSDAIVDGSPVSVQASH